MEDDLSLYDYYYNKMCMDYPSGIKTRDIGSSKSEKKFRKVFKGKKILFFLNLFGWQLKSSNKEKILLKESIDIFS